MTAFKVKGALAIGIATLAIAAVTSAAPITWEATGVVDTYYDHYGIFSSYFPTPPNVGDPFTYRITYDPTLATIYDSGTSFARYSGAITAVTLTFGSQSHVFTGLDTTSIDVYGGPAAQSSIAFSSSSSGPYCGTSGVEIVGTSLDLANGPVGYFADTSLPMFAPDAGVFSTSFSFSASLTAPGCLDIAAQLSGHITNISLISAPAQEYKVFGPASEPSLAADPFDPLHAVVGFNDRRSSPPLCGWAESRDGGATWANTGVIQLPQGFKPLGDPWVRYTPNGDLYYACLGHTGFSSPNPILSVGYSEDTWAAFVAVSHRRNGSTGAALASDFQQANAAVEKKKICIRRIHSGSIGFCAEGEQGESTDHPSVAIFQKPDGGSRLVMCFIDVANTTAFVNVMYSDDPEAVSWSAPQAFGGPSAATCIVGASRDRVGVTWWDTHDGNLKLLTSSDGIAWSSKAVVSLASVGNLVGTLITKPQSTTSFLLSPPYALLIPDESYGLQAVWQARTSTANGFMSQVYIGPAIENSPGVPFGESTTEKFLPGTGSCELVSGAYQVINPLTGVFRYTMWSLDNPEQPKLRFFSATDLNPADAPFDLSHGFRRIGDYTATDCSGTFGWGAWTEPRDGNSEIWAVRIQLDN